VTPLLLAIGRGCSTEVALFLITSGADVNAADMVGTPVLMLTSDLAMVQLLLDAGAAVNARDLLGNTVLHTAAHFDCSAGIICCLLKAGGDVTATDTTGSTPAEVALACGHAATAELLQRAETDQRSKQQQQQQPPQQCAAPLQVEREILGGWQNSVDMVQRVKTASNILNHLIISDGSQHERSAYAELMAAVEPELYRRAADIEAYSDVSTLQCRLVELVVDGVILPAQLKENRLLLKQ
jgi:Ankyrin repeats (many copies)/Ankyrin repeat